MNPHAEEFVPAHILKSRQEKEQKKEPSEAEKKTLDDVTDELDKVDLKSDPTEDDDRFLLKAGENICEFNGEQFIVPGDDEEYDQPPSDDIPDAAGYDFGNAEDNEDEDVCNAFEEFLGNLPDQNNQLGTANNHTSDD